MEIPIHYFAIQQNSCNDDDNVPKSNLHYFEIQKVVALTITMYWKAISTNLPEQCIQKPKISKKIVVWFLQVNVMAEIIFLIQHRKLEKLTSAFM